MSLVALVTVIIRLFVFACHFLKMVSLTLTHAFRRGIRSFIVASAMNPLGKLGSLVVLSRQARPQAPSPTLQAAGTKLQALGSGL